MLVPAGETRDPKRTIPRALLLTLLMTSAFFMLIQFAFLAVNPPLSEEAPMIAFGAAIAGTAGATAITLAALCSLAGNLHTNLLSTPRILFAMAEQKVLPGWFGRVSAAFGTPANAILAFGAAALLLALTGSFVWLAVVGTVARLVLFLMVYASLPKLRRDAGEPALPPPGLSLVLLIATAFLIWSMNRQLKKLPASFDAEHPEADQAFDEGTDSPGPAGSDAVAPNPPGTPGATSAAGTDDRRPADT